MSTAPSVSLPAGETGSTLFRAALAEAVAGHPEVFGDLTVPDGGAFKSALPDLVVGFEARRAASPDRVDIAAGLSRHVAERTLFGEAPLAEALQTATPAERVELSGTAKPGWVPEVRYDDRTWRGAEIGELADHMRAHRLLTDAATRALKWVADTMLREPLVLSDHRFAILGAGAELAPTAYLLQAGARVLWVDREAPALDPAGFAGTLAHAPDALDLLTQAPRIGATVAAEAAEGPLHLGLFAYAPGKGRELLLTAAMNRIAEAASPTSVAMLVSPTTPGEVQPDDRRDREVRRSQAPGWQRALARMRVLREPAHTAHGDVEISRSIVPLQGPTYLAAQYLTKMMVAEAWAAQRAPMRVSANVAGITHTRSLEHPLFLAGFAGAPHFGIHVFEPDQTRVLTTLLALHDLLAPDAPGADTTGGPAAQARGLTSQSIHGGVRSAPFVLDPLIRVAAVLGMTRNPGLLKAATVG